MEEDIKKAPLTESDKNNNNFKENNNFFNFQKAFTNKKIKPIKYLIQDLIPEKSLGVIYGDSGSGKSYYLTHMMGCLNYGLPFFSLEINKSYSCIWLNGEAIDQDCQARLNGWKDYYKVIGKNKSYFLSLAFNIITNDNIEKLINSFKVNNIKPNIIFIDTLICYFGGNEENNNSIMSIFLNQMRKIIRELNCSIVLIHHIGKNASSEELRGASALRGGLDYAIYIKKLDNGKRQVKLKKSKYTNSDNFKEQFFEIKEFQFKEYGTIGIVESTKEIDRVCITEIQKQNRKQNKFNLIIDICIFYKTTEPTYKQCLEYINNHIEEYAKLGLSANEKTIINNLYNMGKTKSWNLDTIATRPNGYGANGKFVLNEYGLSLYNEKLNNIKNENILEDIFKDNLIK